jgi:hypothetical protein
MAMRYCWNDLDSDFLEILQTEYDILGLRGLILLKGTHLIFRLCVGVV